MSTHPLAQPVAVLLAWTMVMFAWMYATRLPAMFRAGIDVKGLRGTTGRSLDEVLPPQVQWKAHNYNHLLEQPVIFYAACLILMVLGAESAGASLLAWAYVAFRIAHSLLQATVNIVRFRFALFLAASIALLGLVILTLRATF